MPLAVRAAHTGFGIPDGSRPYALLPCGNLALGILRVQEPGEAELRALLLDDADQVQEGLAGVCVSALGIAHPDAVWDCFADGAIETLAVAQRLFHCLLFTDVSVGPEPAHHPAMGVLDRHHSRQERAIHTVGPAQRKYHVQGLAGL